MNSLDTSDHFIYSQIREILTTARTKAYSAVNFAMVEAYWLIGKGFTVTNLTYMRQFYLIFPIRHALRDELAWTKYLLYLPTEEELKKELQIAMER